MTKKHRFIILCICGFLFLTITPAIVLYSLGYQIDFTKLKLVATGGIYVRALPQGADIIIDSHINNKTGILSSAVFVQDLLPKEHTVSIKKDGYYEYQKNLLVQENEATKLEHVILIKQNIGFTPMENNVDYFSMAPDNNTLLLASIQPKKIIFTIIDASTQLSRNVILPIEKGTISDVQWSDDAHSALLNISGNYFLLDLLAKDPSVISLPWLAETTQASFQSQSANEIFFIKHQNLYTSSKNIPLIKNVVAYLVNNQRMVWLGQNGFLYQSDINHLAPTKINSQAFPIKKNSTYKITLVSSMIFLQEDTSLFLLNQNSSTLEHFYSPVSHIKVSPDGQKILYYNNHEILFSSLDPQGSDKVLLNRFSGFVKDCYWLNNYYIIFNVDNIIMISEIDQRGNINTVSLPQTILLSDGNHIDIKKPMMFFNQQNKKLYLLTQRTMLFSESLIP